MTAPIVFFDIAGPDFEALKGFYQAVFDWNPDARGQLTVPVGGPPLMGLLRQEPKEVMLYMGVPDVASALEKVVAHGGKIHAPRFEVPGVVVLGLFFDPAGNRMGLVEMDGDIAKVP